MRLTTLLFLLTAPAFANGPAWVSDLSSSGEVGTQSVQVCVPTPGYATVGVHNTLDRCEPKATPGVTAETFIVWSEQRTLFSGLPDERQESIPYYLPLPKWHEPTGEWAVRLHVSTPGTYVIPIQCDTDIVTVTIRAVDGISASDCGFGFYTDYGRYSYLQNERLYFEDMRDHGCNTFTPYGWTAPLGADIPPQLKLAKDVGLTAPGIPVFLMPCGNPISVAPEIEKAWSGNQPLVWYNTDEPSAASAEDVRKNTEDAHTAGYLSGTSINATSAFAFGQFLDVWAVHMDSCSQTLKRHAARKGVDFWAYNCTLRGTNAPLHRYQTGLWAFAVRPKVLLLWSYMNDKDSKINEDGAWNALRVCEHALGTPDGPMDTVGLEGFRDGTYDYRILRTLEEAILDHPKHEKAAEAAAWVQSLVDRVDWSFWPDARKPGEPYLWDVPDTARPPITDLCAMRQQAITYIEAISNEP